LQRTPVECEAQRLRAIDPGPGRRGEAVAAHGSTLRAWERPSLLMTTPLEASR
jgi:hypothetical protein